MPTSKRYLNDFISVGGLIFGKYDPGYLQVNPNVVEQCMMSNGDMSPLKLIEGLCMPGYFAIYSHNYGKFDKKKK